MTADDLQRWASILRWVGLSVTTLGMLITFGSHYVADWLLVAQRTDKIKAQERQKLAEDQIATAQAQAEEANKLAVELKLRQQPRILPDDFIQLLTATAMQSPAKDDLQISCVVGDPEAWALAEQIKAAFVAGDFRFERIVPVMTIPPVVGLSLSARDIGPSPLHACVAAIVTHFGLPLNAAPAQDGEKPWTITIGRKP